MAQGSFIFMSYTFLVAVISLAKTLMPLRCRSSTVFIRLLTRHTAIFSNAPADVKIASSFKAPTPLSGMIIPFTPKQNALLAMAPMFLISVMLSKIINKGTSPFSTIKEITSCRSWYCILLIRAMQPSWLLTLKLFNFSTGTLLMGTRCCSASFLISSITSPCTVVCR